MSGGLVRQSCEAFEIRIVRGKDPVHKQYLQQSQAKMDEVARRYAEFDDILDTAQSETDQLNTIQELIKS